MPDPNIGQLVATVYEQTYKDGPDDNVFNSRATLFALGDKGFKKQLGSGRLIECDVEYAENGSMGMITEFGSLDTNPYDVFDAARYNWKICAGTVVFSELEEERFDGDAAKFDVYEKKVANGRNSHFALLNRQFWNTSTPGANEITALPFIINTTPTNTVGEISGNSNSWWRNKATTAAKTTTAYDNLVAAMRSIWNQCALGGDKMPPTCIVTDATTFGGYEGTQTSLIRYMFDDNVKKGADAGFLNRAIAFKGAPMFFDEDAPSASVYFLNNDILKFTYLRWAKLSDPVSPTNGLSSVHKISTFGNFACGARRHLGVISGIT